MCAVIVDPPQSIPHNAAAGVAEGVSSLCVCVFPQCRATHQDCLVVRATKATVAMHLKTRARPLQIDDQGEHRKQRHSVFFLLLHHFTTLLLLLFASTTTEQLTTTTTGRNPLEGALGRSATLILTHSHTHTRRELLSFSVPHSDQQQQQNRLSSLCVYRASPLLWSLCVTLCELSSVQS